MGHGADGDEPAIRSDRGLSAASERAAAASSTPWPTAQHDELFLIDGNSLAYRAFFALPESIATSTGVPTNAIFGFASMLVKILTEHGPKPTVVVWDAGTPGRKEVYADYKAQRRSRPDLLKRAVAAPRAARRGVRLPQRLGRGLRGRRRDRLARRAAREAGRPGDGRHRRPRRLPARRRRTGVRVMATSRGITDTKVYDRQARDRPLRHPARADPRLLRPQGRHVATTSPASPGIGDKTAARAAAALRRPRDGARVASTRSPAPSARRTCATTPTTRASPSSSRRSCATCPVELDPAAGGRARARPLAPARGLPRVRAARPAAAAGGGARRRRRRGRARARAAEPAVRVPRARGRRRPTCARSARRTEVALAVARAASRPRASCSREDRAWRFGAVAAARRRSPATCAAPAELVARARRPAGRSPTTPRRSATVPPNLAHDTLLGRLPARPRAPRLPVRRAVRGARAGVRRRRGPGGRATPCSSTRSRAWQRAQLERARARRRCCARSSCRSCACCARWSRPGSSSTQRAPRRRSARRVQRRDRRRSSARSGTWPARSS